MNQLAIVVLLSAILANSAQAYTGLSQGQWYFSPIAGANLVDNSRRSDIGAAISLGLGRQLTSDWALEVAAVGNQHRGFNELRQIGLSLDLIRSFTHGGGFAPYLIIGTGVLESNVVENTPASPERDYQDGYASIGMGFFAALGSGPSLRGEVRARNDFHASGFTDVLTQFGFLWPLGAASEPANQLLAVADDTGDGDSDGVADDFDICPATPPGAAVDNYGCEPDTDNDGIRDGLDRCPDSQANAAVDSRGCQTLLEAEAEAEAETISDSDGDGIADALDACPGTAAETIVQTDGCVPDIDGDGVVDAADSCNNTPPQARVDVNGCQIKSVIKLPGVKFTLESTELDPTTTRVLDKAALTLKQNPELIVEAAGYTDNTGSEQYNQKLSQARAESVRRYLIGKGIAPDRISARGYGELFPLVSNKWRGLREQNRRVELRVLN